MTPQPIQARSSADSSPLITPSGTPPPFLSQGMEGRLHHFFAALEGGSSKGVQSDEEGKRRKSESMMAGPSRAPSFNLSSRPALPFFSNLSLSRPLPHTHISAQLPSQSVGMAKTQSTGASSDTSSSSGGGRPDPKRAATLPAEPGLIAMEKRHYDPSREPKLLHFM